MFGNVRIRALLIVLAAMVLIWIIGDRFGMRAKERTYREVVLTLDTARVQAITVTSRRQGRIPLRFFRDGALWRLTAGGDTFRVEREAFLDLLGPLGDLRVKREVGTMDLVKDRYDLTDTLAELLTIDLDGGERRELLVGKSTFSPKAPWSHVNVPGEKEVFAVVGKLSMATEMRAEEWRPRTVVKGDPRRWTALHFQFPGNDYRFDRINGEWRLDSASCDTARVAKYLQSLAHSDAHFVAVGARLDGLGTVARLEITDRLLGPIVVQVYPTPDGRFLLHSTANPDNLLWFDVERELPRLFRPRENWLVGAAPAGPPM